MSNTSTRMLFGHLDHIISTMMLLENTTQSKQISLIFSEILGTIFLVGSKLIIFLIILGKMIKTAIVSYKNPGKMGEMGDSFSSVPLGD